MRIFTPFAFFPRELFGVLNSNPNPLSAASLTTAAKIRKRRGPREMLVKSSLPHSTFLNPRLPT